VSKTTRYRIGMDSGGTFTDVVVLDHATQEWSLYKVLSQHDNPSAVLHFGLEKAAQGAGQPVDEFIAQTEMIILGTTVATNALLQHRGAKVGMLATAGHEDSLEIREGHKEDGHRYDWDYPPAVMLAPTEFRLPVVERIIWDGSVKTPLDEESLAAAVDLLREADVEAVAISFLWSFRNPEHERRAAESVRQELPDAYLTVSHELLPMMGEYNRASTVVLNSYLAPSVARFVKGMEEALAALGFTGPIRYFQANGGMTSGASLVPKAIYALNSGPAAAPTAGAAYSHLYGKDAITIDAGGTSLDVGLVRGSETDVRLVSDVARYRIGIPMVNIETLGAGGGSIAWIDARGLLNVGPQSAEARPGPASYGFGGTEPTVTDALVTLGWFSQESLLGGEMPIDAAAARRAVEERVGAPLGLTAEDAAEGIFRIATENMVGGIRRVSVERGYDPRDAILIAIGGSGPAFACRIARELGMQTLVVPRVASGFCAFGAALSDVQHNYMATHTTPLEGIDLRELNRVLSELEARGRAELDGDGFDGDRMEIRRSAEMRYHDQIHNCLVNWDSTGEIDAAAIADLRATFDRRHEELFTYAERWNQATIVNIHVTAVGRTGSRADAGTEGWYRPTAETAAPSAPAPATRDVYLAAHGRRVTTPVLDPAWITANGPVAGPAVVEEVTTTIVVEEGWSIRADDRGFYELKWSDTPSAERTKG
jgi:N-methylhydantoinase A